ncbi:DUF2017 family protein [Leucobacter sp. cx-328]|uniref:DUF2017 family protein n=1 Tax=unclassified Leucobacter TaxID=2621730 RepID=UPI00165D5959|nr:MULTISPECIES: DUF2017 family protein [unclassified Leucobacter]MBC9943395.1 DUF2017 family protein [Leucobacter sp. cx-328]
MRMYTSGDELVLMLEAEEASMLDHLVGQLIGLVQSHSSTTLDPDPLFASLEVGGSDELPEDPALAALFPNAFEDADDAAQFRRVTEQGLINRKLQDAMQVTGDLGLGRADPESSIEVIITEATLLPWLRTVTSLRIALAARIGIESEEDHDTLIDDEETRGTVMVYDWLAGLLESIVVLVEVLHDDDANETVSDDLPDHMA